MPGLLKVHPPQVGHLRLGEGAWTWKEQRDSGDACFTHDKIDTKLAQAAERRQVGRARGLHRVSGS